MVALQELKSLTGYLRGGVTAIASKKEYPVYIDKMIEIFDRITVSAGIRGTLIMLTPQDYLRVTKAKTGAISFFT